MNRLNFNNALVSVSDKTGLVEFLKPFVEKGLRIVSTGGTARFLRENHFQVIDVSEQTGFPELMDGRVKTLHPHIHMALLARSNVLEDQKILDDYNIEPFDLVIGNLYPFSEKLELGLSEIEQVEFIDVGGPSFLRASAKNFHRITVLCDPSDYAWVSEKKEITNDDRKQLAAKAFYHLSVYDFSVARYLYDHSEQTFDFFQETSVAGKLVSHLRYGENPHQKAFWYKTLSCHHGLHKAEIIQGKELSYNNLMDIDAAARALRIFDESCVVSVKHTNPCGIGVGSSLEEALTKSLNADPLSVFGGVLALNRVVDSREAFLLKSVFLECVIAPDFTNSALIELDKKKNLRVLRWPDLLKKQQFDLEMKMISGGFLLQSSDYIENWNDSWTVIGDQLLTEEIKNELIFAWKVCSQLKSNAIALTKSGQSIGLGMGQVSRVDAVKHAFDRANEHHKGVRDLVLASDAFFPFPDSIKIAASNGVKWVIQPGGSKNDDKVIEEVKKNNMGMVLTGKRHFRH